MPELPEVETVVGGLRNLELEGRRIVSVKVLWHRSVSPLTAAEFTRQLTGRRIVDLHRRAKYVCMPLNDGRWLLIHLRMTGRLLVGRATETPGRHDRVMIGFDDGRWLRLHDTRKFARMNLTAGPMHPPLCNLGPEPLDAGFSVCRMETLLRRSRMIKPLLLDQGVIAGIGNIYADEALWDAGVHPMRRADTLTRDEVRRLHRAVRRVLRRAIRAGGTSLGRNHGNFMDPAQQWGANAPNLRVFRRHGQSCPKCAETLARSIVAQRATHYCPQCQAAVDQEAEVGAE